MLSLILASILAVSSAGVITHDGNCPDLKSVENFNVTAYSGLWYEISKFETIDEKDGKCGTAEYTVDGDVVKVKNTHVVKDVQWYIEGTAKLAEDANGTGKLIVSFPFGPVTSNSNLQVIATDYANYAVAYNCKYDESKKSHSDSIWVLSRKNTLEGEAKVAVDAFLKLHEKEIDTSKLVHTDFSELACRFTSTELIGQKPQ